MNQPVKPDKEMLCVYFIKSISTKVSGGCSVLCSTLDTTKPLPLSQYPGDSQMLPTPEADSLPWAQSHSFIASANQCYPTETESAP